MPNLKLYVWERRFYDYTAGLGVALAEDAEQARDMIEELCGYRHPDLAYAPDVYELTEARAWFVHGGG